MVVAMLADIAIKSSQLLINSAKTRGGVVYIAIGSRETGRECVYKKNLAKLSGGVMTMDHDNHGQFTTTAPTLEMFCRLSDQS